MKWDGPAEGTAGATKAKGKQTIMEGAEVRPLVPSKIICVLNQPQSTAKGLYVVKWDCNMARL